MPAHHPCAPAPTPHRIPRLPHHLGLAGALVLLLSIATALAGCGQDAETATADTATNTATDAATTTDGATTADGAADGSASSPPRRVLLLIADDLGVDQISAYGDTDGDGKPDDGRTYPIAPTFNGICAAGMRFTSAWAAPTCSPTRATILTGRYGFRTGVGWAIAKKNELSLAETTLPELLTPAGVNAANIGKWHLGDSAGGASAPNKAGWPHYSGTLGGTLSDYSSWERTTNGVTATSSTYATTANVDDAIAFIKTKSKSEPWLLWMAFNAPHSPFHKPPNELHDSDHLSGQAGHLKKNPGLYYNAMVQSLDTEAARLIAWLEANGQGPTDIIFIGDNGSPGQVAVAPWEELKSKGTLYEGGVRVPFCVSGQAVAKPGISGALVHTVDLFATIATLFGVNPTRASTPTVGQDSHDLGPLLADPKAAWRDFNYTESFGNAQGTPDQEGRAITDGRFKLIQFSSGAEAFFDLSTDRHENKELKALGLSGEAKQAYDALSVRLSGLK